MTYDQEALSLYRHMVTERHRIWQRRQDGEAQPWTTDPVLANRKFTNMFRVLDPGSQFVFQLKAEDPVDTITRLVFYRITNRPETWLYLRDTLGRWLVASDFTYNERIRDILIDYRNNGNTIFSGAYIIIPEPGTANDKVDGIFRLTRQFVQHVAEDFLFPDFGDRERFTVLRSTPGLGPFLSMQILTDWNYLQDTPPDSTFIVAGPGARRGAALLNPDRSAERVIHDLTLEWMHAPNTYLEDRPLTTMDVQNTLCEFSKYAREVLTPKKITPYKAAHPGPQPKPILPTWW